MIWKLSAESSDYQNLEELSDRMHRFDAENKNIANFLQRRWKCIWRLHGGTSLTSNCCSLHPAWWSTGVGARWPARSPSSLGNTLTDSNQQTRTQQKTEIIHDSSLPWCNNCHSTPPEVFLLLFPPDVAPHSIWISLCPQPRPSLQEDNITWG